MTEKKHHTTPTAADRQVDRFVDAFELYNGNQLNGHSARVRTLREDAIRSFRSLGFPGPGTEAWKYTPIARAVSTDYRIDLSDGIDADLDIDVGALRVPGLDGVVAVMVDGVYVASLSPTDLPDGLTVSSLRSAISRDGGVAERHLGAYTDPDTEAFEALNTAFLRDGVYVHVARKHEISRPVEILSLTSGRHRAFVQPRVLVVVEDDARVTIVEQQLSLGESGADAETFANSVVEIATGRGSHVDHYRLQREGDGATHVCSTRVYQQGSSEVATFTLTTGGKLVRNNLRVLPDGEHCVSHLNGIVISRARQHIDNHTFVDHAKPQCESNELYKSILDDESTGVFNGKVYVRVDAQKTNAYQSSKSILLSDSARMFAKPELEIYADDVRCSHGATTGQLDAEGLFYLQSRGISPRHARSMLLGAFAQDVLARIQPAALRAFVEQHVTDRIRNAS